jgi:hypothetical protein
MSFDKHYPNRKDQRREYMNGSRRFDRTCRNGGSCPWCQASRKHRRRVADVATKEQVADAR